MLCRDRDRGIRARRRIEREIVDARLCDETLDASDLEAVRRVGARLAEGPVDGLFHNAGVLPDALRRTPQGLEICFATHAAGPHCLTRLLAPALPRSRDARVVFHASVGMYTKRLETDDWNWTQRPHDGVAAYAETKRAQVELAALFPAPRACGCVRDVDSSRVGGHPGPPRLATALSQAHAAGFAHGGERRRHSDLYPHDGSGRDRERRVHF